MDQSISVRDYCSTDRIIAAAHVYSGGHLKLEGICAGDIHVDDGGRLEVSGVVSGAIHCNGGYVVIYGRVNQIFAKLGRLEISGVVRNVICENAHVTMSINAEVP